MVTFDKDGLGEISEQETYPDLLSSIHESTTFTFPMMGYPSSKTYRSHFGFIPGVEAPGMIVMVKKQSAASISLTVLKSVFGLWPILMVNILLALIAGIVMWMLVGITLEYNLHGFFTYCVKHKKMATLKRGCRRNIAVIVTHVFFL
jgi:nitrate reductase NapE component